MKKIVIICFTDYSKEPRVLRTIDALKQNFQLCVYSTDTYSKTLRVVDIANLNVDFENSFNGSFFAKKSKSLLKRIKGKGFGTKAYYHEKYWSKHRQELFEKLSHEEADLYIGHGIYTVPILAMLSKKSKTIFNAHEYYLREFEENETWLKYTQPYYQFILDTYLNKVHQLFSVSKIIGNEYLKNYKLPMTIVTNATDYYEHLIPSPCNASEIKFIHHGAAIRSRQLEIMADAILKVNYNCSLTFMLVKTDKVYMNELLQRYKNQSRIKFIDPVTVDEISRRINTFDVGLFFLPPVNYNWENALPNKLFEFIQARLAIVVSPNPDMKRIVNENDIGLVSTNYTIDAFVEAINRLTPDLIKNFKQESHKTAKHLNSRATANVILSTVQTLLN